MVEIRLKSLLLYEVRAKSWHVRFHQIA